MTHSSASPNPGDASGSQIAPFAEWLGIETVLSTPEQTQLRLRSRDEMKNRQGVLHGGVLASLLDIAMVSAARAQVGVLKVVGTVDLHIQYLRPGHGDITVTGHMEHMSRTLAFCRAEAVDAAGHLVAMSSATVRLCRQK